MLTALILASVTPSVQAIELYRQWKPKTTYSYQVKSYLYTEQRDFTTAIYIPETLDQNYNYTLEVGDVTSEGFASVIYKRPRIELIQGETAESGSKTTYEDINEHLALKLSPVNAITDVKDLSPKKDGGNALWLRLRGKVAPSAQDLIGSFVSDLYRLALFIGNAETSVDFGPRLPLLEVEPGDEWHITASYQPQKLKGKDGKMAAQRLDYTYVYGGVVESDGKKVHRVTATLKFDNNIAPFINDLLGMTVSQSGLRGFKLKLDAKMEFDLDYETKNTLAVRAESTGSMVIEVTAIQDRPYVEENIKGRTRLRLLSLK